MDKEIFQKQYVTYHLHSDLSLLDSTTKFEDYIAKAVELGQKAICFTEHGNIMRWVAKKEACDKAGLKYLHGCEVYLTYDLENKVRDNYHTILIAKNMSGLKEINKLISISDDTEHKYYKPRITFEEFINISNNVIKISACLASPLAKIDVDIQKCLDNINENNIYINKIEKDLKRKFEKEKIIFDYNNLKEVSNTNNKLENHIKNFLENKIQKEEENELLNKRIEKLKYYYNILLEKYDYYEIQPHINSEEQKKYNKKLFEFSKKYNKPLIAGTDTHNLNSYKAECRSILQTAKGIEFSNEDEFDLTYKSYDELVDMFREQNCLNENVYLQAIENTNIMADSCEEIVLDKSFKYPNVYEDDIKEIKQRLWNMLLDKINKGIIKEKDKELFISHIKTELKVFEKINMCGFMLFMSDLIMWCHKNNIPTGFGRGSCCGSVIAYVLDIIDVNPIQWNTVFSRFANEDRKEIGDIDTDFAPNDRDIVYNHMIEEFGEQYTAYILALGTVSDKGCIDEIGRALSRKFPEDEIYSLKSIKTIKEEYDKELNKIDGKTSEKRKYAIDVMVKKYPKIFYYFEGLLDTYISQSMHPCGMVVSPITLEDNYGTLYRDNKKILQIDMEDVHEISLVKYDILGLKNIEIIKDTCLLADIKYPKSYEINWNDDKVWKDMLRCPQGIFQMEGAYAFQYLCMFKPKNMLDMALLTAALRPSGASYRDKLMKREFHKNPSKIIDDMLKNNYGHLVFQEDTIKFLQDICGLSGSEADNIRRAIGRKQKDRLDAAMPSILEGYCSMSNQPREIAESEAKEFLQIIEDSASYQFGLVK